jgi:hypothetical protein
LSISSIKAASFFSGMVSPPHPLRLLLASPAFIAKEGRAKSTYFGQP